MTFPASVPYDGYQAVKFVQTIANLAAPVASSEINAVSSVEGSGYITSTGFANAVTENTTPDGRLASVQDFEQPSRIAHQLTLTYVHNSDSAGDNAFYLALAYGTVGFIVVRYGILWDTAWQAGDVVDIYPVKAGWRMKVPKADNTVMTVAQKMFIQAPGLQEDVALV
jgi:hypothetical protein